MITSSGVIMPRSPWLASPGCTKKAGVPVEAKVAAILRPTWPDLPMPVTISRPLRVADQLDRGDERLRRARRGSRPSSAVMPPASASSVRTADAIKARPCSLVRRLAARRLRHFGPWGFRADYRARRGPGGTRGTGRRRTVNAPLTISVLTPLTKAYRPLARPLAGCRRAAAIRTTY